MLRKIFSIFSLFILPAAVLMIPLEAQSDPADPEEVAHIKAGHIKVEGVVMEIRSGLYTVKTATGATRKLSENAALRDGHEMPKIGDELTMWVNEGNAIMDVHKKGHSDPHHQFISGTLESIDYGRSRMTLTTSKGEQGFSLRPESRMFRDFAVGTQVTLEVNETGEVIDIHKDKK